MEDKTKLLYFACAIVATCFLYFFCVTFMPVPEGGQRYADLILGFLIGTAFASVINFYWGSSDGSKTKDEMRK
jgi:hypothetical protein